MESGPLFVVPVKAWVKTNKKQLLPFWPQKKDDTWKIGSPNGMGLEYLPLPYNSSQIFTLLGINVSHQKSLLKMIFLFPRWDMLVPWRVPAHSTFGLKITCRSFFSQFRFVQGNIFDELSKSPLFGSQDNTDKTPCSFHGPMATNWKILAGYCYCFIV